MNIINQPYEIIITEHRIRERVKELGKQITSDYEKMDPVFIVVLKGSLVFSADLIRAVNLPITVDFIKVSSYKGQITSSGKVDILNDFTADIEEKDVLLVEDIVDTGTTSGYLLEEMMQKNARSVKICALLDKKDARLPGNGFKIDYSGFDVPDIFLIGYGLDYKEKYRNLPYIAAFT